MSEVTCRFIEENGTKAWLRVFWGKSPDCPSHGYHNARLPLVETDTLADWDLGGTPEDYPDDRWPSVCEHCGAAVPDDLKPELPYNEQVHRQVFRQRRYTTASGRPEIGDMFWTTWRLTPAEGGGTECSCTWSNCDGRHLYVILPDGHEWDTSSRASNCTMKDDKTHRCWVLSGEPPNVTSSKTGHTCRAGAGSVATGKWHGFLRNGKLTG
jgi:hypothetical protein